MRRFQEVPKSGQRYVFRPGVYAILPRKGRLLLTHQEEPEPEFQLPGGGIDPGEQVLAALHREVFEETGWRIAAPRRLTAYRRFTFMPEYGLWAEKVCHIYVATPVRCHGAPREAGHTAVWTTPEIGQGILASEGDAQMLRDFAL